MPICVWESEACGSSSFSRIVFVRWATRLIQFRHVAQKVIFWTNPPFWKSAPALDFFFKRVFSSLVYDMNMTKQSLITISIAEPLLKFMPVRFAFSKRASKYLCIQTHKQASRSRTKRSERQPAKRRKLAPFVDLLCSPLINVKWFAIYYIMLLRQLKMPMQRCWFLCACCDEKENIKKRAF